MVMMMTTIRINAILNNNLTLKWNIIIIIKILLLLLKKNFFYVYYLFNTFFSTERFSFFTLYYIHLDIFKKYYNFNQNIHNDIHIHNNYLYIGTQ